MPPSGELHAELNHLMGVRDPRRRVQKLMDSTAHQHGGRHREDAVHSLGGVVVELAKRGELTAENVLAANAHLLQDRAFDRIWRALPVKGPLRPVVKNLGMKQVAKMLRAARKGKR